jgi:hypothetical protein
VVLSGSSSSYKAHVPAYLSQAQAVIAPSSMKVSVIYKNGGDGLKTIVIMLAGQGHAMV